MRSALLGLVGALAMVFATHVAAEDAPSADDAAARFVAAVNAADAERFGALIHIAALADRVLAGMDADAPQRADYHRQLRWSAHSLGSTLAMQFASQRAVAQLIRQLPDGPLVRVTAKWGADYTGYNYFRLRLHADGRIEDWYDYGLAMWASEQLRFTSASLLSPADLALLLFRDREALHAAAAMRLMGVHLGVGDHAGAYRALQSLPESLRADRAFAVLAVMLSKAAGMDAYRASLAELARRHGEDDDLQMALIDYYLLESKFDAVLDAVAAIEREFGTDEVVLNNRCTALVGLERYDEALAACDAVLAIDPKNDTALWTRVRMGLQRGDAAFVVAALLRVEEATGQRMDLESLSRREAYAGVRDTPEFQALLSSRPAD